MASHYPGELLQSFLSGEQCLLLALEISEFDRDVRKQKLRREHPEWSELAVVNEIIRQAFLPAPTPEWLEKRLQERVDQQRTSD
jgi:hypothetical protein